jgi:hypothetical protein
MTSAGAPAHPHSDRGFASARRAFQTWRRTRPLWAGLLVLLAAAQTGGKLIIPGIHGYGATL